MASSSHLTIDFHHWSLIGWFHECSISAHFFTFSGLYWTVPWEPLALLVVSLALVNGFHHWPVIKRLSIMLDFNTYVRMLEFVLWSVGFQDPELRLHMFGLHGLVRDYIHDSLMDGCDHTWVFTNGCDHTFIIIMVLSAGWLRPYHRPRFMSFGWLRPCLDYIYFTIRDISGTCACGFFKVVFQFGHVFVKHFTPPTLSSFML